MASTKPVAQWSLADAQAIPKGDLVSDYEVNRKLIEDGDHWQDGTLWPGHRTGDAATDAALRRNVEPQFIADDVAGELVENRSNGLLGQEADVTLVPLDPAQEGSEEEDVQQEEVDAILADLAAVWDRKRLWEKVRDAIDRVSYAKRATLRAYVATGNLTRLVGQDGRAAGAALPTGKTRREAMELVEIDAPLPDAAVCYTEPLTQRPVAVILTKSADDRDQAEVWQVNPATKKTELRLLGSSDSPRDPVTGQTRPTLELDLKGRLPLAEVRGKRIITSSVRRLQSLLNFITTVTSRTVETAGFRERYLGNAEPPGMWLPYAPASGPPLEVDTRDPAQTYYKHRVPWVLGASITTELVGLKTTTTEANGAQRQEYATPEVTSLDPVDPVPSTIEPADRITYRLYKRGKQGHLGMAKTGEASGTAYVQARAQHEADLNGLKGPTEGAVRDLIEAWLAYAGLMSTEAAGILDRYRVQVTLYPSAGPVTAEDARLAIELRDKRAISQQSMQARLGIEDPEAEQEAIDADPLTRAEFWNKMAQALATITGISGMTTEGAGWLLGLSPDQLEVLRTGVPPVMTVGLTRVEKAQDEERREPPVRVA